MIYLFSLIVIHTLRRKEMLPRTENYRIFPSVIPADKISEMTILAAERAFLPVDDAEYTIVITPVDADEQNYHTPSNQAKLTIKAAGGVIRFEHKFAREQEHQIVLWREDKKLATFYVYSLFDDLYKLRPMRGDLHVHSFRSDGARDPAALAGHYREQGYDFFALTDHNRFYPGGEIDEVYDGVKMGLLRIPGEEVHTPGSMVHIVHVGGKESVTYRYVSNIEGYRSEISEYANNVPANVPDSIKERYAMAMWATDNIHKAGGLAIFPHPFWRPGGLIHNVNMEFSNLLLKSGMFDAYEVIGGMTRKENNQSVNLWNDIRAQGYKINVVGSSDVHGIHNSIYFPCNFTICFAEDNSVDGVVKAVSNGYSVAVETTGVEYSSEFRAYGSFRLVNYAQYLLTHYFPKQTRLCEGEGTAMRAYSMGECTKELIELNARLVEEHRQRFFGRLAPVLPDSAMLAFEDRWRKVHLEKGPVTRGSSINPPITRQI